MLQIEVPVLVLDEIGLVLNPLLRTSNQGLFYFLLLSETFGVLEFGQFVLQFLDPFLQHFVLNDLEVQQRYLGSWTIHLIDYVLFGRLLHVLVALKLLKQLVVAFLDLFPLSLEIPRDLLQNLDFVSHSLDLLESELQFHLQSVFIFFGLSK